MTRKSLLLLSALLFCSVLNLRGQSLGFQIIGTVVDSARGTPLAEVTVSAQDPKDSIVLGNVVTDTKGHFTMKDLLTNREKIVVRIFNTGYAPYYRVVRTPKATVVDLGRILLVRRAKRPTDIHGRQLTLGIPKNLDMRSGTMVPSSGVATSGVQACPPKR